jgi:hypothetical protein
MTNDQPGDRARVEVTSLGGKASLEQRWDEARREQVLRLHRADGQGDGEWVTEGELLGLLELAWDGALVSDFFRRQLFHLVMRKYNEAPEALWAVGAEFPPED